MSDAQVWFCDGLYGDRLAVATAQSVRGSKKLGAGSTGSATLVYDPDRFTPSEWRALTSPWECMIAIIRGEKVEFIGYITDLSYKRGSNVESFPLTDLWSVLGRRGAWDHDVPQMKTWKATVTGSLARHASYALIRSRDTGPTFPQTMLPTRIPGQPDGTLSKTYYGYHGETVADVWDGLAKRGLEIYLKPVLQTTVRGVQWEFQAGAPYSSGVTREYFVTAEDSPISEFTVDVDAMRVTNNSYWMGEGSEVDVLARSQRDTDSWLPLLERVDVDKSVTDADELSDRAWQTLRDYGEPTSQWSFKLRTDVAPDVGDTVRLHFHGDRRITDGWHTRRVVAVDVDLSEFVTVSVQPTGGA